MKTLLAVLISLLAISSMALMPPESTELLVSTDTDIIDIGVNTPDMVRQGEHYSVSAWVTINAQNTAMAQTPSGYAGAQETFDAYVHIAEGNHIVRTRGRMESTQEYAMGQPVKVTVNRDNTWTLRATYRATAEQVGQINGWVRGDAWTNAMAWSNHSSCQVWDEDQLFLLWCIRVIERRTWKPVAEHVVFHELPLDAWWVTLERQELDGTFTPVPTLYPSSQLPSPVHADLMIHGKLSCVYRMRVCREDGTCATPRLFTVNWTGSRGVNEVWYEALR